MAKTGPKTRPKPEPLPVEIVPTPVPGGGDPIGEAVAEVNASYVSGAISAALGMGRALARLVGGDEGRLAKGEGDPLLKRVSEHPLLKPTPWVLWSAVNVYLQVDAFPPEVAGDLPLSHHRLLLGVPDLAAKRALAARAAKDDLSKRALAELVGAWRSRHHLPPLGRPPLDPALAALRKMAAAALAAEDALEAKPPTGALRTEVDRWIALTERRLARIQKLLQANDRSKSRKAPVQKRRR